MFTHFSSYIVVITNKNSNITHNKYPTLLLLYNFGIDIK